MSHVSILDCTLRDGGYCNNWTFGKENIGKIIRGLSKAGIEYIECGYLSKKSDGNQDVSIYRDIQSIKSVCPALNGDQKLLCMVNYGEYDIENIPYNSGCIDGIRVAFHKRDMVEALKFARSVKEKGYEVFIQPMISMGYSDGEFLELISLCNEIEPSAVYIVDSFGVMKRNDLRRFFFLVDHNLSEKVVIGFHGHNNLQLAFSNAQVLTEMNTKHDIIMDAAVYGMGRGAGNLNTELFAEHMNHLVGTKYEIKALLSVIDEVLVRFYEEKAWGYSLPNYLAAKHNIHPNYAQFLDSKRTLTVENMDDIFYMIEEGKKDNFDQKYISALYERYLDKKIDNFGLERLKREFEGKDVLMIAPGKSLEYSKDKIMEFSRQDGMQTVCVNFDFEEISDKYIFVSNIRRYTALKNIENLKVIATSNINITNVYSKLNYSELTDRDDMVGDNAGLMLLRLLQRLGVHRIFIAGMDGYTYNNENNYVSNMKNIDASQTDIENINIKITSQIRKVMQSTEIIFITPSLYTKDLDCEKDKR